MIKVALIIERADIRLGGAERSIFELAGQLTAAGLAVTVLAATGQMEAHNVKILCNDATSKRTPMSTFEEALQKHFVENQYDIIHSTLPLSFADIYQPRGGSYKEAMLQNAASYESSIVATCKRLTHFTNTKRTALLNAEQILCMGYEHITVAALSEYVKGHFKQHYNLPDSRIAVIPNAVKPRPEPDLHAVDALKSKMLNMFGLKQAAQPAIFLFAANNFRLKGLTPLLHALAYAVAEESERPIHLLIVGSGKQKKYRKLAEKLEIWDRVLFLGHLNNIHNAMAISTAAVLPTWYDPSSRFILEALSAAVPVITTRFNGAAEMYTGGRHGVTIDTPDDVDELADGLLFFSNSDNENEASSAILGDRLIENVSIARHAKQMIQLYRSIIKARRNIK